MISTTRIVLGLLAALFVAAGVASAQTVDHDVNLQMDETHGMGDATVATDAARAAAEGGLFDDGNYGDLDASVVTDNASAALDADGSVVEADDVETQGIWAWLAVSLGAVFEDVAGWLGLDVDTPDALDANAEAYVSEDGIDLDATLSVPCTPLTMDHCGEQSFDGSPAGDADGLTWEIMGKLPDVTG